MISYSECSSSTKFRGTRANSRSIRFEEWEVEDVSTCVIGEQVVLQ